MGKVASRRGSSGGLTDCGDNDSSKVTTGGQITPPDLTMPPLAWRHPWEAEPYPPHAPVPPPPHPTFDLRQLVAAALEEDSAGVGDVTTQAIIGGGAQARADFVAKAEGVLAGTAVAEEVFRQVSAAIEVEWRCSDGQAVHRGQVLGSVRGSAQSLLTAERVALNFVQRMSGIATATRALVDAVKGSGCRVLETRKTAPGLRVLDKWGVRCGGGGDHRVGLFDMVLIKNNHVTAAGGMAAAIGLAQAHCRARGLDVPVVVEARSLPEVRQVVALLRGAAPPRVDRLLLDNLAWRDPAAPGGVDVAQLAEAVRLVGGAVATEASGNVGLESAGAIAGTGVTHLSCGALTHSVAALDISLTFREGPAAPES